MKVELSTEEVAALHQVLSSYLRDLNYQIANTDRSTFRRQLREHRTLLEAALERLQAATAVNA